MKELERTYEGQIKILLNESGTEFEFFANCVAVLMHQPEVKVLKYVPALFEGGYAHLEIDQIPAKIYFDNYLGTELSFSLQLSEIEIQKLRTLSNFLRETVEGRPKP